MYIIFCDFSFLSFVSHHGQLTLYKFTNTGSVSLIVLFWRFSWIVEKKTHHREKNFYCWRRDWLKKVSVEQKFITAILLPIRMEGVAGICFKKIIFVIWWIWINLKGNSKSDHAPEREWMLLKSVQKGAQWKGSRSKSGFDVIQFENFEVLKWKITPICLTYYFLLNIYCNTSFSKILWVWNTWITLQQV